MSLQLRNPNVMSEIQRALIREIKLDACRLVSLHPQGIPLNKAQDLVADVIDCMDKSHEWMTWLHEEGIQLTDAEVKELHAETLELILNWHKQFVAVSLVRLLANVHRRRPTHRHTLVSYHLHEGNRS